MRLGLGGNFYINTKCKKTTVLAEEEPGNEVQDKVMSECNRMAVRQSVNTK